MMSTIVMHYASNVSNNKWAGAECVKHRDLPWIADLEPEPDDQREMRAVCARCPVLMFCARHALTNRVAGGFYAGVWLPWSIPPTKRQEVGRRKAREALRQTTRIGIR